MSDIQPVPAKRLASYRPDIDGLRAVAVLAVTLFHAFPTAIPGGFVGVDVFFVISGYLITSIILHNLEKGQFSFADFYSRRARRIFPSLIVVLLTCYALGWLLLFKWEFAGLAWHIASGAGFASNYLLWTEAGYFDRAAEMKPLLHLWSLGIEEQFYLLFPLIFFLAHRFRIKQQLVIGSLLLLSFTVNALFYRSNPVATFYLPASRFWELLTGSLLAAFRMSPGRNQLLGKPAIATALSCSGFGLLGLALVLGSPTTPFPGWFALLPVLGAAAIIAAGADAALNRWGLGNAPMRWIGNISYPLYLWHWPLLVFARVAGSGTPSASFRARLLLAAVLLSWLTYRFVEKHLRFGARNRLKVSALAAALAAVAILGAATRKLQGIPSRAFTSANVELTFSNAESIANTAFGCGIDDQELARQFDRCQHDTRETPTVALLGDSKARSLSVGLFNHSDRQSRVLFIGGNHDDAAPLPLLSDEPAYAQYQRSIKVAMTAIAKNPDIKVVVLTMATRDLYALNDDRTLESLPGSLHQQTVIEGVDRVVKAFATAGKKVVITIDNPTLPPPEDCIMRKSPSELLNRVFPPRTSTCSIPYDEHLRLSALYRAALAELQRRNREVLAVFDTLPILCDLGARVCQSMYGEHLYYAYTDHPSDYAAEKIGERLMPFVKDFAGLSRY